MPHFVYQAKSGPGKILEGAVDAESQDQAVVKILDMGYTPVRVEPQTAAAGAVKGKRHPGPKFNPFARVPAAELAVLTRHLSDLFSAGVPVLKAIQITGQQLRPGRLKAVLRQLEDAVRDGESFSASLARSPEIFPGLYVHMVRSGEMSGQLGEVMARLADLTERDAELRSQIRASLIYPALLAVVGGATVFILLTWVIPRIATIFTDLDAALPLPTMILLGISGFMAQFGGFILVGLGLLVFYAIRLYETPAGRLWLDGVKLKLPFYGTFLAEAEVSRFSRALATLLANGVTIVKAVEAVCGVLENEALRLKLSQLVRVIADGASLSKALAGEPLFPPDAVYMIAVGEETGHTDSGLDKVARVYEQRTQAAMKRAVSLIEPLLILVLGAVVGFVVMAMLLPIFRMNMIIR